jgi:hypothetical protein
MPPHADDAGIGRMPRRLLIAWASRAATAASARGSVHHVDGGDGGVGVRVGQRARQVQVVHRRQPRGAEHQRHQGPEPEEVPAKARRKQPSEIRGRVRMVGAELREVVVQSGLEAPEEP